MEFYAKNIIIEFLLGEDKVEEFMTNEEFGEPIKNYAIDYTKEEDLKIFNGLIGFRAFDKEKYADDFIKGKFRTMPINWYSKIESLDDHRCDPEEGLCTYIKKIDLNKKYQIFKHLDGKEFVFFTQEAEKYLNQRGETLKDSFLEYKVPLSNHILCFSWCYYENLDEVFKDGKVLRELKRLGDYIIWFPIKELFVKCCQDKKYKLFCCSDIKYNDSLSNHFLVKKEIYKNQREFRFMFMESNDGPLYHNIGRFKEAGKIII